ncbi:MAG: MraY family glycosyltransferase [Pseudomonadota bacterium]
MVELLSFAAAMLVATALLPAVRAYAGKLRLVDDPSPERKVHSDPIPRSGGIAIFIGAAVAIVLWIPFSQTYTALLFSILIVSCFGLLDDVFDLHHIWKFLPQFFAAFLVVWAYGGLPDLPLFELGATPRWLAALFSLILIVAITNAINLSDGLDGLAAGNCLFSFAILGVLAWGTGAQGYLVIALSIAGAIVGFLRFNTHPASIFMGDLGSQLIGFTAAALTVALIATEQLPVSPMVPILLFGLPILDTLMVMAVRAHNGNNLFTADRNHLHHQLLDLGMRHYEVVTTLYILQAIIVLAAYLLRYQSDWLLLGVYALYSGTIAGSIFVLKSLDTKLHEKPSDGSVDRRNTWLRKLNWYHLHTAKIISALVGVLLLVAGYVADPLPESLSALGIYAPLLLVGIWIVFNSYKELVSRLIGYSAVAVSIYALAYGQLAGPIHGYVDIYFVGMVLALALAIRLTRRDVFHLDTQDYLVGLFLIAFPILLDGYADGASIVRLVAYTAILFYACEYVITKGDKTRWVINTAGIASIGLVAV